MEDRKSSEISDSHGGDAGGLIGYYLNNKQNTSITDGKLGDEVYLSLSQE